MAGGHLSERALDAYRDEGDRFLAELDEELYLHFSGQKDRLVLEPIYERHANLVTLEQALALGASVDGDARVRELWRFSCEGHLGALTRDAEERLAALESTLTASIDGEEVAYRMLRPEIANTDDRDRRERLERARNELVTAELNPFHLEARERTVAAVRELGSDNYLDLYRRFDFPLDGLADQCHKLLAETEELYASAMDRLLRARLGLGLDEAQRWDLPRLFRGSHWDKAFPAARMVPGLEGTLAGLGIDLKDQANIELDLEPRPSKSPRAFCVGIEVPQRVVLVIKPIGGPDDWRALFHEAGHAEHFGNTSADLSFEHRRLGDNAVTEGWAFLLEHLVYDRAWLSRLLNVPKPEEFEVESATLILFFVRRYAAKLLYEIELHAAAVLDGLADRYVELQTSAVMVEPSASDYLSDVDPGFYCTSYLRAWAFETQMRAYLRDEFGREWFTRREAGGLLRELWSEGQRLGADELLRDVTGAELDLGVVADELRAALR